MDSYRNGGQILMRVLIVSPSRYEKGGISTVVESLNENTGNEQISYYYYAAWKNGVSLKKILYSLAKLVYFPIFLNLNKMDAVYIHFAHGGSFIRKSIYAKIARKYNLPVIFHAHSSSFDNYYRAKSSKRKKKISKVFDENCTKLIVLGQRWSFFYTDEVKVSSEKIVILPNAVSIPTFYHYRPNSRIITMFGKMGYRKGSYDLIEVATYFQKQHCDIRFKLYGDGEREKLVRIIKERQLNNIEINGWVSGKEKSQAMEEAGINILPSYNEGLPMAILETMSLGIPNIATIVGSIDEVIIEKHNGFLVSAGDIGGIIRTIETYFYGYSEKEKRNLSYEARKTIRNQFDLKKYYLELNEIIFEAKKNGRVADD